MKNYYYFAIQLRKDLPLVPFCGTIDQAFEYQDVLAMTWLNERNISFRREEENFYVCEDCGEQLEDSDKCPTCGCEDINLCPLFETMCDCYLDLEVFDTDRDGYLRLGGK